MFSSSVAAPSVWGLVADVSALSPAGLVGAAVPLVSMIGVGVMLWGTYQALLQQLTLESATLRAQTKPDNHRLPFSHYLALGLEFMIAACAIKTLSDFSLEQVGVLGGMVGSRVLVGLYPRWDARAVPGALPAGATADSTAIAGAECNSSEAPALAGAAADSLNPAVDVAGVVNPSMATQAG